ncbi:MAG TPA: radical SAM protein [Acidobacteriota bacterium]
MSRVLLLAMPDSASCFDGVMDMPNLGVCSLAGNLEDCQTRVVDLVIPKRRLTAILARELRDFRPDLVGISAMTYQYRSACVTARLLRRWQPELPIVLGGYHVSLLAKDVAAEDGDLFDVLVRHEGESAFPRVVQALERAGEGLQAIPGVSYRSAGGWEHNPDAALLNLETIRLPDRSTRAYRRFRFMGRRFDCAETSRGCVLPCSFCTITQMYGKSFRVYPTERILDDLAQLRALGVRGVFFVDDNITLNIKRLARLCEAILAAGYQRDMEFILQATVEGIAADERLAGLLHRAGVRLVFMGIESGIEENLKTFRKKRPSGNTEKAVRLLKEAGIVVVGGFIVGTPDDDRERIYQTFRWVRQVGVDHGIVQCLTPYPRTQQRLELEQAGLITNPHDYQLYNGFIPNLRTRHLSPAQIAGAMWRAGLKLYWHPGYMLRSQLWRYYRKVVPRLLINNLRYLLSGARGKLFFSTHSFG